MIIAEKFNRGLVKFYWVENVTTGRKDYFVSYESIEVYDGKIIGDRIEWDTGVPADASDILIFVDNNFEKILEKSRSKDEFEGFSIDEFEGFSI